MPEHSGLKKAFSKMLLIQMALLNGVAFVENSDHAENGKLCLG